MAVALVTGASSGIGLATSVSLARGGHTVIATMRNPASGDELRKIISDEKLPVTIAALDVDQDDSVTRTIGETLAAHGHIDILVNNAGVGGGGAVEETPQALFRQVMETNYFGALRCLQAVIPSMRERRQGCIVNVTSIAGRMANSPQAAYAASKFALEALSECLAQEMKAFNVRVAIVEPGVIATPIFGKFRPLPEASPYPQARRLRALFAAALSKPVSPYVVGEQIRQIVESESSRLRYPVGPDALPLLQWRASKTDEEIIERSAMSDAEYVATVKREFGLDLVL